MNKLRLIYRGMELLPLHKHPEYLMQCCRLINDEWKRSETARLRSLEGSTDKLPTCLILVNNKNVIGHCKLTAIPRMPDACFIESVVIDKQLRGKGYGKHLMLETENYCKLELALNAIYLSTHDQEGFYAKLGYEKCMPISIYGNFIPVKFIKSSQNGKSENDKPAGPLPPPLPPYQIHSGTRKVFMNKIFN